jgi:prepilin-type N-terminal cleavage/methylation domain-containing protein
MKPMKIFSKNPGAPRAFTLIELLVVISIIAVLAAFAIPVMSSVKRQQYLKTARGELDQISTALENYKATYGVYPPAYPDGKFPDSGLTNQLYYELSGTTNNTSEYVTLDNAKKIKVTDVKNAFDVGGFINCDTANKSAEDSQMAKSFLPSLSANRIGDAQFNGISVTLLTTSARGPDANYQPLNQPDVNPFRYMYPGTNNPNSYDLWIDLVIKGKTNRVSNWSSNPQIIQ